MKTYPNQKIIHIQKSKCNNDFLQVNNNDWHEASKLLSGSAFKLYMYLSENKDGFDIALSQKDVENTIGLPENTYRRAVSELISLGFLNKSTELRYNFNTSQPTQYVPKMGTVSPQNGYSNVPKMGTEKDNTYKIYNSIKAGRRIRDLTIREADEIKNKIKNNISFLEIEKEYGMQKGVITPDFENHWKMCVFAKVNGKL